MIIINRYIYDLGKYWRLFDFFMENYSNFQSEERESIYYKIDSKFLKKYDN